MATTVMHNLDPLRHMVINRLAAQPSADPWKELFGQAPQANSRVLLPLGVCDPQRCAHVGMTQASVYLLGEELRFLNQGLSPFFQRGR